MKLYIDERWLSPYTHTVFIALREKKISFELEEVSFEKGYSLPGMFQERSFTDLIPAFEDGALFLSESWAILEYLEEKFPAPRHTAILPLSIEARAQARMLLSWYRCGMQALRQERSMETVFYPAERAKLSPLSKDALEEVEELKSCLRSILKPGAPYLFGEWSIADAETALMLHRLIANGESLEEDLAAYARAIWQRPVTQEFVARSRPPYVSYYR